MKVLNIEELIHDYIINDFTLTEICKKYHIGKLKAKAIFKDYDINLKKKGKKLISSEFIISDFRIKKYKERDGYHFEAYDNNTDFRTKDYMNKSGILTSYIEKEYNITTPTLYDRRLYYQRTGNYWWEQWLTIEEVEDIETKKCPYCDWKTKDIKNKSGAFELHLKNEHNKSIEDYIKEFPNEINYFNVYKKKFERDKILKDEKYYVECPICGEKFKRITLGHLKSKHGITMKEFKEKFKGYNVNSYMTSIIDKENFKLCNLTVSKKRFVSKYEMELQKFLELNGIQYSPNRQILIGREIDLLIEDKRIGIEFDGLKFHTENFGKKDRYYHLNKTIGCNEKGYGLIHIFEDEFVNHKEIVFNKLRHILKLNYNLPKIGGRNIVVKEIYKDDAEIFLNEFHIQGFVKSTIYYGGYYNGELIAVMSFKRDNIKTNNWEFKRFATKSTYYYQGVASKMFTHFVREHNPDIVVSFADRRWTIYSDNNMYIKLGFELVFESKPDYMYYNERINSFKRFNKIIFNKKYLNKKYNFPINMSKYEMIKKLGFDKIWDCGRFKFVWKKN